MREISHLLTSPRHSTSAHKYPDELSRMEREREREKRREVMRVGRKTVIARRAGASSTRPAPRRAGVADATWGPPGVGPTCRRRRARGRAGRGMGQWGQAEVCVGEGEGGGGDR